MANCAPAQNPSAPVEADRQELTGAVSVRLPPDFGLGSTPLVTTWMLSINDRAAVYDDRGNPASVANMGAGATTIGAEAQVKNVYSVAPVQLRSASIAWGDVRGVGSVARQAGALVKGSLVENGPAIEVPTGIGSLRATCGPTQDEVALEPDQSRNIEPGSYRRLLVKRGARVGLPSGKYCFEHVFVEPGGTLAFSSEAGPVQMFVSESFTFRGRMQDSASDLPRPIIAYTGTQRVSIESAGFSGYLLAPDGSVEMSPGAYNAEVFAGNFTLHQGGSLKALPPSTCSATIECPDRGLQFSCQSTSSSFTTCDKTATEARCSRLRRDGVFEVTDTVSCTTPAERGIPLAQTASAHDWDWCNTAYFVTTMGLRNHPYDINGSRGVDLSNISCEELKRDWVLYERQMQGNDRGGAPGDTSSLGASSYFTLYNPKKGILRMFQWIDASVFVESGQLLTTRFSVTQGSNADASSEHALTAYEGGNAYSISQRKENAAEPHFYTSEFDKDLFLVTDTYLSFDPRPSPTPLFFTYVPRRKEVLDLKLSGSLKLATPVQTQRGLTFSPSKIPGSFKQASEAYKSVQEVPDAIMKKAKTLRELSKDPNDPLAAGLTSIAGAVGEAGPLVGGVFAGYKFFSGFLGHSGGSKLDYSEFALSAEGTITEEDQSRTFRVPVSTAFFNNVPYYAKSHPALPDRTLGLINFVRPPKVKIYLFEGLFAWLPEGGLGLPQIVDQGVIARASVSDPLCDIVVNPVTGARVSSTKVRVEITNRETGDASKGKPPVGTRDVVAPYQFPGVDVSSPVGALAPKEMNRRTVGAFYSADRPSESSDCFPFACDGGNKWIANAADVKRLADVRVKVVVPVVLSDGTTFEVMRTFKLGPEDIEYVVPKWTDLRLPNERDFPSCAAAAGLRGTAPTIAF